MACCIDHSLPSPHCFYFKALSGSHHSTCSKQANRKPDTAWEMRLKLHLGTRDLHMICDSVSILIGKHPMCVCVNQSHLTYANSLISQCGGCSNFSKFRSLFYYVIPLPPQFPWYHFPSCDPISDNTGWVTQIFKPFNSRAVCFYPWWLYLLLVVIHSLTAPFPAPTNAI